MHSTMSIKNPRTPHLILCSTSFSLSSRATLRSTTRCYYATTSCPPNAEDPNNNSLSPPKWPATPDPTPYDIFAISRNTPYTKKRFYQLVKLYHPDRHTTTTTLPTTVLTERYRLVVAANTLLSDPARRHLYDTHGLGWYHDPSDALRHADKAWRTRPGNASMNATWEDWERWHAARRHPEGDANKPAEPVYMSNGMFALLVGLMCCVAGVAQMNRAETAGQAYVDTVARKNVEVGEVVRRSAMVSAGMSKDERVDRFLRDRESVALQFEGREAVRSGLHGGRHGNAGHDEHQQHASHE